MGNFINYDKSFGLQNSLQGSQSPAIIAQRAPTTADAANPGQYWLFQPMNAGFICNGSLNGMAQWAPLGVGPGNVFPDLTVNPGPTNLTGTLNVMGPTNINANFAGSTNINTGTSVGQVFIGNLANAGSVLVQSNGAIGLNSNGGIILASNDPAADSIRLTAGGVTGGVQIQSGTNGVNINLNINQPTNINTGTSTGTVTIGNAALTSANIRAISSTIQTGIGGSLNLMAAGNLITTVIAAAPGGFNAALTANVGNITFAAAIGIIAGASQVLTITNANATANSVILTSLMTGAADLVVIQQVTPAAGSWTVTITNVGGAPIAAAVNLVFWIMAY